MKIFNPWHNVPIGDQAPRIVSAIIEIPRGSKGKYELDKSTGMLHLNRVLFSAVFYPANYGLVPQTYYYDNDPLDILVLCSIDLQQLSTVDARVIGVMRMSDDSGQDDKILAVAHNDAAYTHINDLHDLPQHTMDELKRFFEDYKKLEKREVTVGEFMGREEAYQCIAASRELYHKKINNSEL